MSIVENQIVSLEYQVFDDGKVVDSNKGADPLIFMFGKGQIIKGLEDGIKDMATGDKSDIIVKPKDAYGEYDDTAIQEVPKEQFAGIDLKIGMSLYGQGDAGETVQVVVKEIGDENIMIDFNHPLAGRELMFSVVINNIREASDEEIASGTPVENVKDDSECCGTGGGCGCD